jgi:hypothetical protein
LPGLHGFLDLDQYFGNTWRVGLFKKTMNSKQLLQTLRENVNAIAATVNTEFVFLEDIEMNFKRSPESWSILECFEHLNRYSRFYNPQFEKAIATTSFNVPAEEATSTWIGKKFIRMMHPETIRKSNTLKHMNPLNSRLDKSVLDEFLIHQSALLALLNKAERVNLNKVKIPVEFLRLFKMNLGDALQFVIVHEQRHVMQAKNVRIHRPQLVV